MASKRDAIADDIRASIANGTYQPGDVLPDQPSMMRTYEASSVTVSAAMKMLRDEGLVWRVANRGLVVQDVRPMHITLSAATPPDNGPRGPWETACHQVGRDGTMRLISSSRVPAEPDVAQALQLSKGTTVVRRVRHALLDGQVVMLDTAYYPLALVEDTPVAGSGKVHGGILAALTAAGVLDPATARVREVVGARIASKDEVELLRLRPGVSVLTAERVTLDGELQPVELLHRVANPRRIRFANEQPLTSL